MITKCISRVTTATVSAELINEVTVAMRIVLLQDCLLWYNSS